MVSCYSIWRHDRLLSLERQVIYGCYEMWRLVGPSARPINYHPVCGFALNARHVVEGRTSKWIQKCQRKLTTNVPADLLASLEKLLTRPLNSRVEPRRSSSQ